MWLHSTVVLGGFARVSDKRAVLTCWDGAAPKLCMVEAALGFLNEGGSVVHAIAWQAWAPWRGHPIATSSVSNLSCSDKANNAIDRSRPLGCCVGGVGGPVESNDWSCHSSNNKCHAGTDPGAVRRWPYAVISGRHPPVQTRRAGPGPGGTDGHDGVERCRMGGRGETEGRLLPAHVLLLRRALALGGSS